MPENTSRPHERTRAARIIRQRIDELGLTNQQVMDRAGFAGRANHVTMIKLGNALLPFEKVDGMATALEIDRHLLMRLALEQRLPEGHDVFEFALSQSERMIVSEIRKATRGCDPTLTPERRRALHTLFGPDERRSGS